MPKLKCPCSTLSEWILLKASGQKCEPLHLNTEDRQRIEEIKRELLQHTKVIMSATCLDHTQTPQLTGCRHMSTWAKSQQFQPPT